MNDQVTSGPLAHAPTSALTGSMAFLRSLVYGFALTMLSGGASACGPGNVVPVGTATFTQAGPPVVKVTVKLSGGQNPVVTHTVSPPGATGTGFSITLPNGTVLLLNDVGYTPLDVAEVPCGTKLTGTVVVPVGVGTVTVTFTAQEKD